MAGRLEAICRSERRGIPKTRIADARLAKDHGLEGDAHAGAGHRQISILGLADIEAFSRAGGLALAAGAFAENLVVSGIDLAGLGLGSRLRVGERAVLSIPIDSMSSG